MLKQASASLRWSHSNGCKNHHGKANWIHAPEVLQGGHVAYLVKFLGKTEVDQPKGIEVVKEGIRKMKFNQHLRRAEGAKTPKVELTISVDGVAIQDPKSKKISYQYPLHRISYCADDKSDPKFFSFIAKEAESERHSCFVFASDKLSEEITLTIGQAFELAYKRFLETSGRDLEMRKQIMVLHKKVQELEAENRQLKNRLSNYESKSRSSLKSSGSGKSMSTNGSEDGTSSSNSSNHNNNYNNIQPLQPPPPPSQQRLLTRNNLLANHQTINLLDMDTDTQPTVGRKLENLSLDDPNFDPRSFEKTRNMSTTNVTLSSSPLTTTTGATTTTPAATTTTTTSTSNGPIKTGSSTGCNGPLNGHSGSYHQNGNGLEDKEARDIFGFEPFNPETSKTNGPDPFGMGSFEAKQLEQAIGDIDKKLAEMRDGFSRGLSFGYVDFSMETLDPLN